MHLIGWRALRRLEMQLRSDRKRALSAAAASPPTGQAADEAPAAEAAQKPRKNPRRAVTAKLQKASTTPEDGERILYRYETLEPATLVRRYKRFLADVVLQSEAADQQEITVHCPNTGPMVGLLDEPSPRVQLSKSADPKRKYAYTLEMIQISVRWARSSIWP